jgi:taurine dioxygenase
MADADGLSLLRELAAQSTQTKYQYRVKYGVGDVVVWDNASVLHSATLTDADDARTLFRITVKETQRPLG